MSRDCLYLLEVLACIERIRSYAACGRDEFFANPMVQDAIIRNIEVIGEAVRNISPALLAREPSVPWRNIAAMRNILIHRYFRIELPHVWTVVDTDLAPVADAVRRLTRALSSGGEAEGIG